jgi:hypothetical protein
MLCLIDADILCYRVGFAVQRKVGDTIEVEPVHHAYHLIKTNIAKILKGCSTDTYRMFLTSNDKSNYRFDIAKTLPYKGTRVAAKPVYYNELRQYMVDHWGAELVSGKEADDALGIAQMQGQGKTIICGIDKDLLMIPGLHYNFVSDTHYKFEDPGELFKHKRGKILGGGIKWFYAQMLMGDSADNIPGLKGIGPIKTLELLKDLDTEEQMLYTVRKAYEEKGALDRFEEVANLLWIQREPGVKYTDRGVVW